MGFVRRMLAKTFLQRVAQRYRNQMQAKQWTALDQAMHDFYAQFILPGELFFDVGANMGNRTKIALKLGADVVAVEPQNECVRVLKACYSKNKRLTIVQKVLGPLEGQAEIMLSNANTLSTLSKEWIESVKGSGRFQEYSWDKKQVVHMATLDKLISQYGMPAFIKMDVEGFEYEVVRGLTHPVKSLSLEFTPEFIEATFKCLDHLQGLGEIETIFSLASP